MTSNNISMLTREILGILTFYELVKVDEFVKNPKSKNYLHQHADIIRSQYANCSIFRLFTRKLKLWLKKIMDELFDIVNMDDKIVGSANRSEVHGNPALIHRVSHVLVFNQKGELYLQKRSLNKDIQPGKWDTSVGGHLDKGESYHQAAVREMNEELSIENTAIEFLYKYFHTNNIESEYVSTFKCIYDGKIIYQETEIDDGAFWSMDRIRENKEKDIFTPNFLDELSRFKKYKVSS